LGWGRSFVFLCAQNLFRAKNYYYAENGYVESPMGPAVNALLRTLLLRLVAEYSTGPSPGRRVVGDQRRGGCHACQQRRSDPTALIFSTLGLLPLVAFRFQRNVFVISTLRSYF